ncbi:MAG: hypothetical protein EHM41_18410 [Chloroflexi bacterium]|nr:MAG: hypothetical protein EHM41_18410 [Chloroflexota bacterium]
MSIFAKITAVILLVFGILVMVAGVITGINGLLNLSDFTGMGPFMGQMMGTGITLAVAAAIFLQGLVVTAIGEVLYLLAQIADNTFASRRGIVDRVG